MSAPQKPSLSKKLLLFIVIGLVTLVLYLYYFVGTSNIADVIRRADLLTYASAFVAFILGVVFSSLTWRSLLKNLAVKVNMRRVFTFMWVGMFFDATVPEPGWSGDISKAYMLAKTSDEDTGKIVASVVSQKIIGMAVTVLDLVLGFILLARNYLLAQGILIFVGGVLAMTVCSLAVVWYVSTRPKVTSKFLDWLIKAAVFLRGGRWDPTEFRGGAQQFLSEFHQGIRTLGKQPRALIKPTLLSLTSWVFDVSVVFLVFASLGYAIPFDKVLIIYALTGSLQIIGISFVGFTEIIVSGAYTVLGVPAALSLSVTLLTRVVTLWFKLVVSYFAFQWAGVKILAGNKRPDSVKRQAF